MHKIDEFQCRTCGKALDASMGVDGKNEPSPGDFSVCLYCATVSVFTETGVRRPTRDEDRAMRDSPLLKSIVDAINTNNLAQDASKWGRR